MIMDVTPSFTGNLLPLLVRGFHLDDLRLPSPKTYNWDI
jgi:hypothetical protein